MKTVKILGTCLVLATSFNANTSYASQGGASVDKTLEVLVELQKNKGVYIKRANVNDRNDQLVANLDAEALKKAIPGATDQDVNKAYSTFILMNMGMGR